MPNAAVAVVSRQPHLPRTGEDDDTDDDESAACHLGEETDKEVTSLEAVETLGSIACLALLVATMFNNKRLVQQYLSSHTEQCLLFPSKTKRDHETTPRNHPPDFFFPDIFSQS